MVHMHYKGTGKVHSFRGLLADGDQHKIRIQGPVGAIAWRMIKFQLIYYDPTADTAESVVCVWREKQSALTNKIAFDNGELLAAGFMEANSTDGYYPIEQTVVFDNDLFVRNIYITNVAGQSASNGVSYYIELEEVKVSAAGMAQLAVAAARRTIS